MPGGSRGILAVFATYKDSEAQCLNAFLFAFARSAASSLWDVSDTGCGILKQACCFVILKYIMT